MEMVSSYWLKGNARSFFIRVGSEGRSTVQKAGSSVCGFSLKCKMRDRPLPARAARLRFCDLYSGDIRYRSLRHLPALKFYDLQFYLVTNHSTSVQQIPEI